MENCSMGPHRKLYRYIYEKTILRSDNAVISEMKHYQRLLGEYFQAIILKNLKSKQKLAFPKKQKILLCMQKCGHVINDKRSNEDNHYKANSCMFELRANAVHLL